MSQAVQVADLQRIAGDTRISLEGKAIILYLVTRPAGYRLTIPDLVALTAQARVTAGPKTIYNRLKELIAFGYVSRKLIQGGADYFIHPVPPSPCDSEAAIAATVKGE